LLYLRHPCRRLPYGCASALRGSLSARPYARSELVRILRAILRTLPPRARRATWGPGLGGILAAEAGAQSKKPDSGLRWGNERTAEVLNSVPSTNNSRN